MAYKHNYKKVAWGRTLDPKTGKFFIVTLDIDLEGLLDVLGAKAMASKAGEARECNGDVRVRARLEEGS